MAAYQSAMVSVINQVCQIMSSFFLVSYMQRPVWHIHYKELNSIFSKSCEWFHVSEPVSLKCDNIIYFSREHTKWKKNVIHNWTVNYRGLGFRDIGWLLWLDCSNAALHIGQRNGSKYCCYWFQTGLSWITAYFCPSFCQPEPIDMHRFNYTIKIRVAGARARWGWTIFGLKFHYVLKILMLLAQIK